MISLQHMLRITCAVIFCFAVASTSAADVIHNESVDGDLSGDENAPTPFLLSVGSNEIIASTTGNPNLDRDIWQITIPTGFQLSAITLTEYTNGIGNRAYFAVQEGGSISLTDGDAHLGGMLIDEAMDGTDILDDLGSQFISGDGFSPPLPAGDYTFWYQELSDDTTYSMDFVVSIPEPTSALVVAAFGFAVVVRRKRK